MFQGCSSLQDYHFNIAYFDTKKVKTMENMFAGCSSLEDLNLWNFKTDNLVNMSNMFHSCKAFIYHILILKMLKICQLCFFTVIL